MNREHKQIVDVAEIARRSRMTVEEKAKIKKAIEERAGNMSKEQLIERIMQSAAEFTERDRERLNTKSIETIKTVYKNIVFWEDFLNV